MFIAHRKEGGLVVMKLEFVNGRSQVEMKRVGSFYFLEKNVNSKVRASSLVLYTKFGSCPKSRNYIKN